MSSQAVPLACGAVPGQRRMVWMPRKSFSGTTEAQDCIWADAAEQQSVARARTAKIFLNSGPPVLRGNYTGTCGAADACFSTVEFCALPGLKIETGGTLQPASLGRMETSIYFFRSSRRSLHFGRDDSFLRGRAIPTGRSALPSVVDCSSRWSTADLTST